MFENLSARLSQSLRNIIGKGRLTDKNIKNTLREVRVALLEADVALPIVRDFISQVKQSAIGQEINNSLTPGQEFIKIVRTALVNTMGEKNNKLNLIATPAVVIMAGLHGAGKTTTVSKLGKYIKEKQKKKVLVVSADIYRPAAIRQLEILAHSAGIDCVSFDTSYSPVDIVNKALYKAKSNYYDVLLVDTAGRLHVDNVMMDEISNIHAAIKPVETLFVVDSMTGQDAANTAKAFNNALPLTGIILTKVDSDVRGGAALSIRHITGKPIKFIGVGEKIDALEPFDPYRLANRILGMGDVLSIIEKIESKFNHTTANKLASKLHNGHSFDLTDFMEQLQHMRNIGGIANMMSKLPNIIVSKLPNNITNNITSNIDDKIIVRMEAIINSMTAKERVNPEIIKGSRKRRIAAGSGIKIQDINKLLKQFSEIQRMLKTINKGKGRITQLMKIQNYFIRSKY